MCTCYRNWRGNDCSEQTCQFGVAFMDTPNGDLDHDGVVSSYNSALAASAWTSWTANVITQWSATGAPESFIQFGAQEAHGYMECSNKGLCGRSTGDCVCFDGYEGSACQRTVCPNACNGNGVCRNIVDLSRSLSTVNAESYPLWDGLKNQHCVCDPGFSGNDCSIRLCPVNADPLTMFAHELANLAGSQVYQSQTFVSDTTTCTPFYVTFTDYFGEAWTTGSVNCAAAMTAATLQTNLQAAFDALPNGVTYGTTVACADDGTTATTKNCKVTFNNQAGKLATCLVSSTSPAYTAATGTTVSITTAATNTAEECSARGICDYTSGLCKCFRGYRTADCHLQHALAY